VVVALLEDDALLRDRILAPRLREHGFDVICFGEAAAFERVAVKTLPDILLLDVDLRDADGFELAASLRIRFPDLGVVMLTSRRHVDDQVRGLVTGADAFLVKPVEIGVLVATLYSLARRLGAPSAAARLPTRAARDWHLEADGWRLNSPCGRAMPLTRSERPVLRCLLEHAGQVVHREMLIATLTGDPLAFDTHRLDSIVHRLRRKAGALGVQGFPLSSIHGVGYLFQP